MVISNSADAYKIPYNILVLTGIWPKENPNIIYRTKTLLSWIFAVGLSAIFVTQFVHDIRDFTKLSETLYIMVTYIAIIVKFLVFSHGKREFLSIIKFLKNPLFLSYSEDLDHYMAKSIKRLVVIGSIFVTVTVGALIFYSVYPILDNKPLPFPFPYDLGKYTLLMYCFEMIGVSVSALNNISLDLTCISLMGIAAAQLDILTEKIMRLEEDDAARDNIILNECSENIKQKLKDCIQHHLAIIWVVQSIDEFFAIALFGQCLASAVVICNTIFDFILIPISTQLIVLGDYLVAILIQLFLYCWYGNEITVKSLQIQDACFKSNWYALDKETCRCLFIIMERSKRPLRITIMKVSVLSLTAFTAILQWSYSYLALLLNLYSKNKSSQHT